MVTITQAGGRAFSRSSFWLGVAAYLAPTFPIAYVWHLVLFAPAYEALGIFRPGLAYGLALAVLSWSFTTLAVAAKNIMGSVPLYVELETGFTLLQFAIVGPLIALAHRN